MVWKNSMWGVVSMFLWGGTPMLVTLVTFFVYTLSGNVLPLPRPPIDGAPSRQHAFRPYLSSEPPLPAAARRATGAEAQCGVHVAGALQRDALPAVLPPHDHQLHHREPVARRFRRALAIVC
jgi:hypothetical protein